MTTETKTILQGTGLLGDGTPTEEIFATTKAEFNQHGEFEPDDPDLQRVLALRPGEETVVDCGAGGAWRVRCVAAGEGGEGR